MKEIVPELAVQDLAGAESLLCAVFGFARDGDMLRLNDQRLALVQADGPRGHGGIDHLALSVNDTDAALAHLIARGARLDQSVPGSGLGLAIVTDLARLYGGDVRLDTASLGGLGVALSLPAAD
mgnify:CR=1 FL=1